jgi:spore coat protein SA
LFIEKVAGHLNAWRPVIISPADPELPRVEIRGQAEYYRIPLAGWRQRLYTRYRRHFPLYDRKVAEIIRRVKPDLVHVHNRPLLALSLKRRLPPHLPIILHMHNLYESLGKRERPEPGTPIPVAGFVGCSRFVVARERERLGRGAGLHQVVYNGVEPSAFIPLGEEDGKRRALRAKYQLTDEPIVLFAGKVRESKGVGVLLTAMGRVWQAVPRAALVLVGGTEYGRGRTMRQTPFFEQLQRQIAGAPGRVVLTGFLPPASMPAAYLLGDIFAAPSQVEEGLGMVFLEAAAAGLPLVASRVGGIPEIVREGLNGLLLDQKNDPGELAEKIISLLRDPEQRKKLGTQGRQWVLNNFSWEKITQSMEQVYDEVWEKTIGGGG